MAKAQNEATKKVAANKSLNKRKLNQHSTNQTVKKAKTDKKLPSPDSSLKGEGKFKGKPLKRLQKQGGMAEEEVVVVVVVLFINDNKFFLLQFTVIIMIIIIGQHILNNIITTQAQAHS